MTRSVPVGRIKTTGSPSLHQGSDVGALGFGIFIHLPGSLPDYNIKGRSWRALLPGQVAAGMTI